MARYRIKEAAESRAMSLKTLARVSGLSETRVRDIANNRVDNVSVRTLEVIAATLNAPLYEMFDQVSLHEVPILPAEPS